jgi:post-segregation antitoxin (ccd killing protein)
MRSGANAMGIKGNVVLYLDRDLVKKSKELGFNLSKTFENHLKQLTMQYSQRNSINKVDLEGNKITWCGRRVASPNRFKSNCFKAIRFGPRVSAMRICCLSVESLLFRRFATGLLLHARCNCS